MHAHACRTDLIVLNLFPLNVIIECGGLVNLTIGSPDKIEMVGYQTNLTCTWLIKVIDATVYNGLYLTIR